jgi:hypothetical protein
MRKLILDFVLFMGFTAPGTFYWDSLVGERNGDSQVPYPSPHWDNHWSWGMIKIESWFWDWIFFLPNNPVIPSFWRKQGKGERGREGELYRHYHVTNVADSAYMLRVPTFKPNWGEDGVDRNKYTHWILKRQLANN